MTFSPDRLIPGLGRYGMLLLLLVISFSGCIVQAQTAPPQPAPVTAAAPHVQRHAVDIHGLFRTSGLIIPPKFCTTPRDHHRLGVFGNMERFSANIALFRLINAHRHRWLDTFCYILLPLGSGWILLPILIVLLATRSKNIGIFILALVLETLLVNVLKPLLSQPRPAGMLDHFYLMENLGWKSFPSGDVAMAFTIAWSLWRTARRPVQIAVFTYAALIAYERIYVGVHFPLDVLAGAVVGMLSVEMAGWLLRRRVKPEVAEPQVNDPV